MKYQEENKYESVDSQLKIKEKLFIFFFNLN